LAYRAIWNVDEDAGEHWVDFPKVSDPASGIIVRVSRKERQLLPFVAVTPSRPLAIRTDGRFRKLLALGPDADELTTALTDLSDAIDSATSDLSASKAISHGFGSVVDPLRPALRTQSSTADLIRFVPEGGTVSGILRALTPAIKFDVPDEFLRLDRHGSTLSGMLSITETDLLPDPKSSIVVVDDFGDTLDSS